MESKSQCGVKIGCTTEIDSMDQGLNDAMEDRQDGFL